MISLTNKVIAYVLLRNLKKWLAHGDHVEVTNHTVKSSQTNISPGIKYLQKIFVGAVRFLHVLELAFNIRELICFGLELGLGCFLCKTSCF